MDGWLLDFAAQVASTYGYVDVEVTVVMCMLQNTLWQRVMYTRLADPRTAPVEERGSKARAKPPMLVGHLRFPTLAAGSSVSPLVS